MTDRYIDTSTSASQEESTREGEGGEGDKMHFRRIRLDCVRLGEW